MKSRINVEAITSKINLEQLGQEIITRSEKGDFRPHSPITAVLDRLRPALLKARENKASFSALARYLNEKQIAISEASLRKYLNMHDTTKTQGLRQIKHQRTAPSAGKKAAKTASLLTTPPNVQGASHHPQLNVTRSVGGPRPSGTTPSIPG